MMVAPPDRRSDQIKLATFLLDKGADPNNRGRHDDDGSDDHHHDDSNDDNDDDSYDSDDDDDDDDERYRVIHLVLWLDKGGYSAIDHAAANNDEEVICLLLEFGANVLRVNHTLVAQRHHILRRVRYR